ASPARTPRQDDQRVRGCPASFHRSVCLEALAQALQAAADPALHGSERATREPRDVLMRISAYKRKLEAMLLPLRQQAQALLQQSGGRQPGGRTFLRLRFTLSGKA